MTALAGRFDMYGAIHKALRRFMNLTVDRLGRLDVADDAELGAALDQTQALLAHLRSHLRHENDHVHTAIEARVPAGARRTADDHAEHLEAIVALEDEAARLRAAPTAERDARAARLYRHLALFAAENVQHMHHEETVNQALLHAHYSDVELVEIHDRLIASIPPAEMMDTVRWLAPALSPRELAAILADMQAKAPPPAFAAMLGVVRGTLESARWERLAGTLAAPALAEATP